MGQETDVIERLEKLGFKQAANTTKEKVAMKRKLAVAYEHFRFVREEKIQEFKNKLSKERTKEGWYKNLVFTPIGNYSETPPLSVLKSLEEAMEKKCFDSFEIAHIEMVKDPILFGRVNGCTDRFFIDQWDEDLNIDQIIGKNEG